LSNSVTSLNLVGHYISYLIIDEKGAAQTLTETLFPAAAQQFQIKTLFSLETLKNIYELQAKIPARTKNQINSQTPFSTIIINTNIPSFFLFTHIYRPPPTQAHSTQTFK
jgi:hypothetical protein